MWWLRFTCGRLRLVCVEECGRLRMSPDSSSPDISSTMPQTEEFPACLWFAVFSLQWLVGCGQASVDPEVVARESDRLYIFAAFSSPAVGESSRTAILQPPNAPSPAPKRTTMSNRSVYSSNGSPSLQASGVIQRSVCWRDTHKVSPILQLSCSNLHRKVLQLIVCRTHDKTQRSAFLHVFPQSRHCPLSGRIAVGGGAHRPHSHFWDWSTSCWCSPHRRTCWLVCL